MPAIQIFNNTALSPAPSPTGVASTPSNCWFAALSSSLPGHPHNEGYPNRGDFQQQLSHLNI